jgi:integrase
LLGIQNIHGSPKNKAPAITTSQLKQMVQYLKEQDTLSAFRNNALIQLGFFGAFRRSELANMQWQHIHFVEQGIEILIPRSKGDQRGEGQICALPYGHSILCPVTALKDWRDKTSIHTNFIFHAINRHEQESQAPLTTHVINLIIKTLAHECQLPHAEQISAHSLRRGFATETSRNGAPFASIMRHGRWKHEKTVLEYIEEGQRFIDNAIHHLFK